MDTQLIDCQKYILSQDNPCNTELIDEDTGTLAYRVFTEHTKNTTTRLHNADKKEIASWKWNETLSDVLTFGTSKAQSSSGWLKKSMIPFKDTVYFQASDKKKYKWKGNSPGMVLELYSSEDKVNPIARFAKSRRNFSKDPSQKEFLPACLLVDDRGLPILDEIVLSFLILERKRRINEVSTVSIADAHAANNVLKPF